MEFDDLLDEPETQHIKKLGIPHEDHDDEFSRQSSLAAQSCTTVFVKRIDFHGKRFQSCIINRREVNVSKCEDKDSRSSEYGEFD
jgi:hypothetical protein